MVYESFSCVISLPTLDIVSWDVRFDKYCSPGVWQTLLVFFFLYMHLSYSYVTSFLPEILSLVFLVRQVDFVMNSLNPWLYRWGCLYFHFCRLVLMTVELLVANFSFLYLELCHPTVFWPRIAFAKSVILIVVPSYIMSHFFLTPFKHHLVLDCQ